jgi:hypothetical protein
MLSRHGEVLDFLARWEWGTEELPPGAFNDPPHAVRTALASEVSCFHSEAQQARLTPRVITAFSAHVLLRRTALSDSVKPCAPIQSNTW